MSLQRQLKAFEHRNDMTNQGFHLSRGEKIISEQEAP